jgi:N6-adenosine-specific RNA methylase IME4
MIYSTILADPPWDLQLGGKYQRRKNQRPESLPYPVLSLLDICKMPIGDLATEDCHLWLWTTNQHLEDGFKVMREWGFRYLAPIHWVKPSGLGNYFVHRTQTLLFGYRKKCRFPLARYRPNIILSGNPVRHSQKPKESFDLIESISPGPRLELFAREKRSGWHTWGNEIENDICLNV